MHQDIFIHVRYKLITRVNCKDILLIEADGNYSKITTTTGSYLLNATLTRIEAALPPDLFCRVHRTYIIPISRIKEIDADVIHLDNKEIPLAKQYRKSFFGKIKILK